ncbi:MAG TPA: choice-of-anchor X domain-containing protein [Candidatus Dormibacteraeota bacterium]|nr:choice-of-anchor X domain-containing protein [Candidatus Dormibacteraeota bacterium]
MLMLSGLSCRGASCGSGESPDAVPPPAHADFVSHPPVARSLSVQLLDPATGAAQLLVGYAADPRLGQRVALDLGGEPVELRDDGSGGDATPGDGVYTGPARLDVAALVTRWREVAATMALPGFTARLPRFAGREITGVIDIPPLDVEALRADLLARKPVPLGLSGTCSVSPVDPKASLFITHPDVITDPARSFIPCGPSGPRGTPGGVWSFGYLMRQLAGGSSASTAQVSNFIKSWLGEWQKTGNGQNGWPLSARPLLETLIVQPWKAASAGSGVEFDPDKAPFRLLAIVNRTDLSKGLVYGAGSGAGDAGEVRFVFGALSAACQPLRATVIFEYGVDRADCLGVRQWAQDWIALSGLTLGSTAYRDALAALTAQVTTPGALGQLRTDELSFDDPAGGSDWDLREFHLDGGALVQRTVAQTPQHVLNDTPTLRDYLNANAAAIAGETDVVPFALPSGPHFRGDHAFGKPVLAFWKAAGILPYTAPDGTVTSEVALRHTFSRNTCNGCHNDETGTSNTHVNPMLDPDAPSQLSGFLTGITAVADPVAPTVTYDFGDLERRKTDLAAAGAFGCFCHLMRLRIDAPH